MANSPGNGTLQLTGSGSVTLTLPGGLSLETIEVSTPPGVAGSTTPYTESITWSQQLVTTGWWFWTVREWHITVTWDVVVTHELTYTSS